MAPPSFFPPLPCPVPSFPSTHTNISCSICMSMLDRPIELGCGNMVCLLCCTRWLSTEKQDCPCCPCCDSTLQDHASSPSRVTMSILGSQLVNCIRGCNRTIQAEQYIPHIQSQCQNFFEHSTNSPSRVTIQDLLEKDKASPTTPTEKKVAEHLIKRLMAESEQGRILQVPTRGQVLTQCIACAFQHEMCNLLY